MARRPLALDALDAWPSLTALEVSELSDWNEALTALRVHPRITELTFEPFPWQNPPTDARRRPAVANLTVRPPRNNQDLTRLRAIFPGLISLDLDLANHGRELDLTPLHDWPDVAVRTSHNPETVLIGADELDGRLY
ncbi:hypothetical protein [Streptomyces anulatus]|uniref:hypothetical protein n=1 Tax=Streptomyces anulatus TaxID=1892 RepID=UPI0032E7F9D0